jgi:chondroitin-sulfate-ABC endolyase/exolyase
VDVDGKRPVWLVNHLRQGYYVHPGTPLCLQRVRQTSPDHRGHEMTEGDFATTWLDHGCAPGNGSYAYCVVVDVDPDQMGEWSAAMHAPETAHYRILRQDNVAHAVVDRETGITGCVVFDSGPDLAIGSVVAVSKPCLLIFGDDGDGLELSICNPNLNLQPDEPPQTEEFTLYAQEWISNPSQPDAVEITLEGEFALADAPPELTVVSVGNGRTVTECECRHGLTYSARLRPRGRS